MSIPPPSDELCIEALTAYARHGSYQAAADSLNLPRERIRDRCYRGRKLGLKPLMSDAEGEVMRLRQQAIGLEDELKAAKTEAASIRRDNLTAEIVRTKIMELAAAPAKPPAWTVTVPKKGRDTLVPATLWSDWHWGEVVSAEEVGGLNSFDMAEAHKRVHRLVEGIVDLAFNHGPGGYPGIVVCLGGDMVSGDIHEELSRTNEQAICPVLLDLRDTLVTAIEQMVEHFGKVFIPCVPGNHGRLTHKRPAKQLAHTNLDWLLYGLLERHFDLVARHTGAQNVKFLITADTDVPFRIYNHRYLLTHGDNLGTRGGDGIIGALGPILRGDFKTRNQQQAMQKPYDTLLMGHWHQRIAMTPKLIVNSSLKGFDEYAKVHLRAMPERPQQELWYTHPSHGITRSEPVFLTDSDVTEDAAWTSWAA